MCALRMGGSAAPASADMACQALAGSRPTRGGGGGGAGAAAAAPAGARARAAGAALGSCSTSREASTRRLSGPSSS